MAYEIPPDLIKQIQISTRHHSGLSSYNPSQSSHLPSIPSLSENISSFDSSPSYLRCKHCKGKLIGGVQSFICIYCARLNDVAFPDPILFKDTIGYNWLLKCLNLDGSEMVEPHAEKNETTRGQGVPKDKISLSELLDFKISWRAEPEKLEHEVKSKEIEQSNSFSLWNGIELDDFFLESKREQGSSMSDQPVVSTQVQLEGTKSVTTHDNPYSFQQLPPAATAVASTVVKDNEFSGWQADFQSEDTGVQDTSQLYGTSAASPIDLSSHIDSFFGSGKDSKDEILITGSTSEEWTSDDLRNNVTSETFPQSVDFDLFPRGNSDEIQNKVEKPSTSGGWFETDDWGINNMNQPHKGITTDDNISFAEGNDLTFSSDVQFPSGSVSLETNILGSISHGKPSDLNLFSSDDKNNDMDFSGFGAADSFSDPFSTSDNILEADNIPAGVSSSDRMADLSSVVEDATEHGAVDVEPSNACTNPTEDVHSMISQMHDLSFMLKDELAIPSKSADHHDFFL